MVKKAFIFFIALMVVLSCQKEKEPEEQAPSPLAPEYYSGGNLTVFQMGMDAFLQIAPSLSASDVAAHNAGSTLFFQTFDESSGLGPLFLNASCAGCHTGNGRSQPPLSEGDTGTGLLIRFSISGPGLYGEPLGAPDFGTQYQTQGITGIQGEGHYFITHENVPVTYPDGTTILLQQPYYNFYELYTPLPSPLLKSARLASPVYGVGLLEAVSLEDILSRVDENDANSDGISGKVNHVWNVVTQQMEVGRFGWKASMPNVIQQTAGAFNEDMGITSEGIFPVENCIGQSNCVDATSTDIGTDEVTSAAFYLASLGVPAPRNLENATVQQGKQLFTSIGCISCHVDELHTGNSSLSFLSNQTIYPYTDLLLHDLGEGLGDGRPDYDASANEWRTPPLWGIGLSKIVNPNATFLHDGRAATLEEAILWHGGEAYLTTNAFKALNLQERQALIAFLEAL